jgi:hypothetical protein
VADEMTVSATSKHVDPDDPHFYFKWFTQTAFLTGMVGIFFFAIFTIIKTSVFRYINAVGKNCLSIFFMPSIGTWNVNLWSLKEVQNCRVSCFTQSIES